MSNVFDLAARASSQSAAAQAAAKAAYNFTIELWTFYAVGVAFTLLRTYARGRAVGLRNLKADDYLVWFAILFYTAQTALAYKVVNVAHGFANNGMTDAQRAALSPHNPEYQMRVIGSKIQVAGWTTYSTLIGSLKLSMLAFYIRLMEGLGRRHRIPIYVGFVLVIATFIASVVTIFAACRPLHKYWQINPNPGDFCQPAISKAIVWVSFTANLLTDTYLIFIPIPMLWTSSLKVFKKIAVTIVLSAGVFVLVCATLKSVFVLIDPIKGAQLAGEWGTRETFVAVITTNLPMVFHLCRGWLSLLFGRTIGSSERTYKSPLGGGGSSRSRGRNRRGPPSADHITTVNLPYTESEERMVQDDVKMQRYPAPATGKPSSSGIVVSNQFEITHESRNADNSEQPAHGIHETWLHQGLGLGS